MNQFLCEMSNLCWIFLNVNIVANAPPGASPRLHRAPGARKKRTCAPRTTAPLAHQIAPSCARTNSAPTHLPHQRTIHAPILKKTHLSLLNFIFTDNKTSFFFKFWEFWEFLSWKIWLGEVLRRFSPKVLKLWEHIDTLSTIFDTLSKNSDTPWFSRYRASIFSGVLPWNCAGDFITNGPKLKIFADS